MNYLERLLEKYPKHVFRDGYIGTLYDVQPLPNGDEAPIYRFPGGVSLVDEIEIANGFNNREPKTLNDWHGSLEDCFSPGDLVADDVVEKFLNILPPATLNGECIQMGEPTFHTSQGAAYPTLKKTPLGWVYAGNCYRGRTENVELPRKEAI